MRLFRPLESSNPTDRRFTSGGAWHDQAPRYARERNPALSIAETADAYGEMLALRGEIGAARERLAEAPSVFRRMSARPHIERTELALAELE